MDLLDIDVAHNSGHGKAKPGAASTDGAHAGGKHSGGGGGEAAFWNDVLGDDTVVAEGLDASEEEAERGAAAAAQPFANPAAMEGVTAYSSWPAGQWASVEVNVLGTLTEDLTTAERFVGWRLSEEKEEEEQEEEEVVLLFIVLSIRDA